MNKLQSLSKYFQKFLKTQKRSINLVKLYMGLHETEAAKNSDLLRSAVVLSVASMDAYFTDKFCDMVVPVIKKTEPGDSLVKLLVDAGLDAHKALELIAMERPYRRIRTLVTSHLERRVTQRFDAIDELFLCLGFKDFCSSVEAMLGRKNLLRRVQLLVERRHKIVHDGDYNQHHKLRPIDPDETLGRLRDVLTFVGGAEKLLKKGPPNK